MQRLFVIITILLLCLSTASAQDEEYMYEVGGGIGSSWGYGDANRSQLLYNPKFAYDLIWRYNVNLRWALAVDVSADMLSGDTRDFDNKFPNNVYYDYDTHLWQLAFRPEFTFWNYGLGSDYREKHRLAPFLTLGLGFGMAHIKSNIDVIPSKGYPLSKLDQTKAALTVPIGLGLKWKIAPRLNAQLTCMFSKIFSDELDGIDDPYHTGTTVPMNTDWTGTLKLSITFDFKERCIECHNQDN